VTRWQESGYEPFYAAGTERKGPRLLGESTRYGSYAMESLINEILKQGGLKSRLELKLFGAGKIYGGQIDVGARNSEWVLNYVKTEGLSVVGRDLGDVCPVRSITSQNRAAC